MYALALLLLPPAQEAPPPLPPPPPAPPMMQSSLHLAKELGLSVEQKTHLQAIDEAHRDHMRTLHEAFREAQITLMDAAQGGQAGDLKALNTIFAARHLDLVSEVAAIHSERFAVLTPAQQEMAKEIRARHRDHGMNPPGQDPGGPPLRNGENQSSPPERGN